MDYRNVIAVTNRSLAAGDPLDAVRRIAAARPKAVILREKDLTEEEYKAHAREVRGICLAYDVPLFIHSHVSVAGELGTGRLHLSLPGLLALCESRDGKDASSGTVSGTIRSQIREISVSCHSMEDVQTAVRAGADRIILGNIFETDCKKGLPGKGLSFLSEIARACPVPVYAIGGITPDNLEDVIGCGAAGGCMMSWWYRGRI